MRWLDALMSWRAGRAGTVDGRWVVLDVESSGLDPRQDRLLAIAAVAVRIEGSRALIDLGDSFEVVLGQPPGPAEPDRQNILLHGIGVGAQQQGVAARAALQSFWAYAGASPLIAFHAAFDRALIERACRAQGLATPGKAWLDLEPLAGVLQPTVQARSLDEWMQALGIHCAVRHQAAADTLATAELLLKLWPALVAELPHPSFRSAAALAAQRRWLPG